MGELSLVSMLYEWTDKSWHPVIKQCEHILNFIEKPLRKEYEEREVYPPYDLIFNAFYITPFNEIKVVIVGQDPYHNPGEAHGLCFSVPKGVKHPPSLVNIFKELEREYGLPYPESGDLTPWAEQGVFLLNAVLTVRRNEPGSHRNLNWEKFTDEIILRIAENLNNVVFMLWGAYAIKKERIIMPFIEKNKHCVLKASHPSPLSKNDFIGCDHFIKANDFLIKMGKKPINWAVE